MKMRVFKCNTKNCENAVAAARRFSRDEDGGAFIIFVVVGFLLIFATAGIGVDIMNFERDRASLQGTLDRAVLAAANVKQKLPPKDVVISYIEKSDVRGELTKEPVVVDDAAAGSRKVTANAEVDVPTHFMWFFGYPTLTASVTSVAEEAIGSVEISLVLDISGSMAWDSATKVEDDEGNLVTLSKLEALQDAAKNFVTTMYAKENPDKISISIIPYATQVNAGGTLLSKMPGVTNEHNYSHCVDFTKSEYSEYWIDPAKKLNRAGYFDPRNTNDDYERESSNPYVCPTRAGSAITPLTNDIDHLNKQIEALSASGRTSIEVGIKWGAGLLDPQFQPVIAKLAADNVVPSKLNDRPKAYESNVKKVLIVMTDGENTENWEINDAYRSGLSDVWYNPNGQHAKRFCWRDWWGNRVCEDVTRTGEYSVRITEEPPEYFYTRQGTRGHSEPFEGEGNSRRLSYAELWNQVNLDWNARWNYGQWYGRDAAHRDWHEGAYTYHSRTEKNTRTENICTALKNKNVEIYAIAFEAPEVGVNTMRNCASGTGRFFKVKDGGNLDGGSDDNSNMTLSQVFEAIATNIKQLRLTQ
ncbi:TadE/TadG family type IV pilus assembly protein [Ruegeria atlantica]|uniref:TadE/TadG family type IV pilus assembly protein n=1 Tax=Ruegeria atlantica TaxID=81569 RepID=UPI0014803485|nr:TadE/TadG family type IV pilus assembly protein [Ruegeria atlantica]